MKIFDLDSPFMQGLTKMSNLLLLNLLALVCCIPIVTIGASLTALNYMTLKMVRNEDCYIVEGFFKSFKENFKQATIIWLLLLLAVLVLVGDFLIMKNYGSDFNIVLKVIITMVGILVVFTSTFLFPTLAKFDNPVFRTIKNAFVISVLQLPKTILMIIFNLIPWLILLGSVRWVPLAFFFGFSAPAYFNAMLYNKFFKKLEAQIQGTDGEEEPKDETEEDTERIFHDEVDEGISLDENRQ